MMTHDQLQLQVAAALGLPPTSPKVEELMSICYSWPYKYWQGYKWWQDARDDIEFDLGGKWGVVSWIAQLAVALHHNGQDIDKAAYAAGVEVSRDWRREYAIQAIPLSDHDAPTENNEPHNSHIARVNLLYNLASEAEWKLLDLLQGMDVNSAARALGISSAAAHKRVQRLRAKVLSTT